MSRPARILVVVALYGAVLAAYVLSGDRSARLGVEVPLTPLDGWLPRLHALAPVYLAYFPFLLWVFLRLAGARCFARHLAAPLGVSAVSVGVFLVWPTRTPRPPIGVDGWCDALVAGIRAVDPPGNSFPSLHVSLAVLAAFLAVRHGFLSAAVASLVTAAILLSTVAIGQHVALDVAGGVLLALGACWLDRSLSPPATCRCTA